jgi:hypothetical protein
MAKKLLFVIVLLLLVSVQALAASCDLRCSLMGPSTHSHALHNDGQMADCQGMSMDHSKETNLTASDTCSHNGCGTALKAIVKSADQGDAYADKLLVSAVALLVDPFGGTTPIKTHTFAVFRRDSDTRPLAQRPGSSLRI